MTDCLTTVLTHDDVTRWFGALAAVARLLPNGKAGANALGAIEDAAHWAHRSLDAAGVLSTAPAEE